MPRLRAEASEARGFIYGGAVPISASVALVMSGSNSGVGAISRREERRDVAWLWQE